MMKPLQFDDKYTFALDDRIDIHIRAQLRLNIGIDLYNPVIGLLLDRLYAHLYMTLKIQL